MEKTIKRGILVILAVVLAAALSGCNSKAPETSPSATPTPAQQSQANPSAAPTPSAAQSPSISPSAPPTQAATPEPVIDDDDPDDEPYYEEDDEYDDEYDYEYEFYGFFFQEYYYLDGDDTMLGLYFWDDGEVDLDDPEDSDYSMTGEFYIDDDMITIYVDDEEYMVLWILDCATLEDDDTGEVYALEGALHMELETSDYYYLDADEYAGNLWFWDDGDVDIEDPYGDIVVGTYEMDGDTIIIELDGEEVELTIINSYILESEYGEQFIRIP